MENSKSVRGLQKPSSTAYQANGWYSLPVPCLYDLKLFAQRLSCFQRPGNPSPAARFQSYAYSDISRRDSTACAGLLVQSGGTGVPLRFWHHGVIMFINTMGGIAEKAHVHALVITSHRKQRTWQTCSPMVVSLQTTKPMPVWSSRPVNSNPDARYRLVQRRTLAEMLISQLYLSNFHQPPPKSLDSRMGPQRVICIPLLLLTSWRHCSMKL